MSFLNLGSRSLTGILDQTGQNQGNWSVVFDDQAFGANVPYFEVYKIIVSGAPNSTFSSYIGAALWEANQRGDSNTWNGSQQITPGTELRFFWSDSATDNTPPTVTLWLRYDIGIPQNQRAYK